MLRMGMSGSVSSFLPCARGARTHTTLSHTPPFPRRRTHDAPNGQNSRIVFHIDCIHTVTISLSHCSVGPRGAEAMFTVSSFTPTCLASFSRRSLGADMVSPTSEGIGRHDAHLGECVEVLLKSKSHSVEVGDQRRKCGWRPKTGRFLPRG